MTTMPAQRPSDETDRPRRRRYDDRTVSLHWIIVALVVTQWSVGRLTPLLPRGPLRLNIWSVHVLLGLALAGVLARWMVWRASRLRREWPLRVARGEWVAAVWHAGLYVLLVGVVGLGVWNVLAHGFPLFGGWHFPKVGGPDYAKVVNPWHSLFANLLAAAAFLHACAALGHRYVLRDDVLARMQWPPPSE